MNLITILYLATCFLALYFGIYLLRLNYKATISKVFFLVSLTAALWAFTYAFMQSAPNIETALLWRKASVPWWCIHYGFFLHFFLLVAKKKRLLKKWWVYLGLYAPGVILTTLFLTLEGAIEKEYLFLTDWGWTYLFSQSDTFLFVTFTIYYLSYTLLGIIVVTTWWWQTEFKREKKQAQIILSAFTAAIVVGSVPDVVFPVLGVKVPPLGILINLISLPAMWYIIKEYRFMALSTERINKDIFETMEEGMLICNVKLEIKRINQSTKQVLGYQAEELLGQSIANIFAKEKDKQVFEPTNLKRNKQNYIFKSEEKKLLTKTNEKIPSLFSASILRDKWDEALGIVCTFQDITELKEAEKNLTHLTYHDQLTGLYNRTYLDQKLKQINSIRETEVGLIMIDLNGLKLVNDGFGHEIGDEILQKTAEILEDCCRAEDIVSRWGGDEFVIVLFNITKTVLERIKKRIKKACAESPKEPISISLSLGSAIKDKELEDIYEVLKEADDEMYKNKLKQHKAVQNDIFNSLLKQLEIKSCESQNHIQRLEELATLVAQNLGLSKTKVKQLSELVLLHDIGKVTISEDILKKPSSLTAEEWLIMKKHCEAGYRIVSATDEFAYLADAILHHHEWWDGSGYPDGLQEHEIPLLARIMSIIDAYEVMTSGRPYQEAVTKEEAQEKLKELAGIQFDPQLVELFMENLK